MMSRAGILKEALKLRLKVYTLVATLKEKEKNVRHKRIERTKKFSYIASGNFPVITVYRISQSLAF